MRFVLALIALLFASPALAQPACESLSQALASAKNAGLNTIVLPAPQVHNFQVNLNARPPVTDYQFDAIAIVTDGKGHMLVVLVIEGCVVDIQPISEDELTNLISPPKGRSI